MLLDGPILLPLQVIFDDARAWGVIGLVLLDAAAIKSAIGALALNALLLRQVPRDECSHVPSVVILRDSST